jgi:hypothetical protein
MLGHSSLNTMNDELERVWKEVVLAYLQAISRGHLEGRTDSKESEVT